MTSLSATDDYLNLILASPALDPPTILSVFLLTLARIIPIISLAPFLGSRNLPASIRMMCGVSFVALFLPQNLLALRETIPYGMVYIGLFCKELAVGLILGFLSAAPFYVAQMAGSMIDHQRGSASLQVTDPSTQTQSSPIGLVMNYTLIVVFFSLGGPFIFLNGVADSYQLIPVDRFLSVDFFQMKTSFWQQSFSFVHYVFSLSIQLAAPALIGILLTDLFLGIANRLAPQVQIVFLGISLKSWVGIALLCAAWVLTIKVLGKESIGYFNQLVQLIRSTGLSFVK